MTDLARLDSSALGFDAALARLTAFESKEDVAIEAAVAAIVADVRARGDAAVLEYTARFDRVQAASVAALELPAEELAASPAEMSDGGHRAKPPPSACSRRPTRRGRRPAADGYLIVVRQRAPFCRHLFWSRLLTRHPGTSARFSQIVHTQVEASSPPY